MIKNTITNLILNNSLAGKTAIIALNARNYGGNKYEEECSRRAQLDLWDCQKLSTEMKPFYSDLTPNSSYYGIMHHIKKYASIDGFCNWNVEHGLYLGEYVEKESMGKAMKGTITFSDKRKRHLESMVRSKVVTIGPYIHYADDYYSEDKYKTIKAQLGRVLLAFPPHSTRNLQVSYDTEVFIEKLKSMSKDYDTVMVCMFFKDILFGGQKPYEEAGFTIVTSGHMYDYHFLSRQKEMIKLSDYTVSASVGTHIGYCLYMGKEHEILSLAKDGSTSGNTHESIDKYNNGNRPVNEVFSTFKSDQDLLLNAFIDTGMMDRTIQHKLVSEIWGFDCIRKTEELHTLLTEG